MNYHETLLNVVELSRMKNSVSGIDCKPNDGMKIPK
jgi:hypothetical protein